MFTKIGQIIVQNIILKDKIPLNCVVEKEKYCLCYFYEDIESFAYPFFILKQLAYLVPSLLINFSFDASSAS